MSFIGDIAKFKRKAGRAGEMIFRGTALSLFSSIVRRTPVDSGRLRGNWSAGINRPKDETGEYQSTVARARLGESLFLTNNLPYAQVIENGRVGNKGSYQAPKGMVRVTISEFKQVVREQARKA